MNEQESVQNIAFGKSTTLFCDAFGSSSLVVFRAVKSDRGNKTKTKKEKEKKHVRRTEQIVNR